MPKVTFYPENKSGEVPPGTSLLDAAEKLGITINHDCGGFATCSTCRILIVEGTDQLTEIDLDEENMLEEAELAAPFRLSCQAKIQGEVIARIPDGEMRWDPEALQELGKHEAQIRQVLRVIVEAQARNQTISLIDLETATSMLEEAQKKIAIIGKNTAGWAALVKEVYEIP